jgi:hypothetical protein
MHKTIATATLKSGEVMPIECVLAPDDERAPQILPFLGHKPGEYRAHIEASFADECDDLETRYYIGLLGENMVGNIMTVEANGIGILGHVHTREDQRRKGICQAIMGRQMEDFRERGGQVLMLGTGFESAPYWIYHSFGFRDLPGGRPGIMWYHRDGAADFLKRFFAPDAPRRIVPAAWKHWPLISLMSALPSPVYLRNLTLGAWGPTLMEGPYCGFRHRWGNHPRAGAVVLESETGAVVGMATRIPEGRWPDVLLLDVFAHPLTEAAELAGLIDALPSLLGKTICFADPRDTSKIVALEQTGFHREAVLPGQFREGDTWQDAWLYTRRGE